MDWTMVANADDAVHRLHTIVYLFRERYRCDAREAGQRLRREPADNQLCQQVVAEIRSALKTTDDLSFGKWIEDREARLFLAELLMAYDAEPTPHVAEGGSSAL